MEPTKALIDDLYREKVERARRMSLARRVEVGAELSDMGRQMMREAIRAQQPAASEERIRSMMHERITMSRRLDDTPLPVPHTHDEPGNSA